MNPSSRPTIVIIEDDEAVRQTLSDLLDLNGFRPVVADDGQRASPPPATSTRR